FDNVGVAQSDLTTRGQTEELFRRLLAKIVLFDVDHTRKWNLPAPLTSILWIVHRRQLFHLTFRIVVDDHPQRAYHRHDALATFVQIFAHFVLQHRDIDSTVTLAPAKAPTKLPVCSCRV